MIFEALFGLGTLLGIGGGISEAAAREEQLRKDAEAKRAQADELERRGGETESDIRARAKEISEEAQIAAAHKGVYNSTLTYGALVRTALEREKAVERMWADVKFRADQLRRGADASSEMASDVWTAGLIKAGGGLLGGVASLGQSQGWFSNKPPTYAPSESAMGPFWEKPSFLNYDGLSGRPVKSYFLTGGEQ